MKKSVIAAVVASACCAVFTQSCGSKTELAAESQAQNAVELEPTSKTVVGERVLLFLEYPHVVRGAQVRFLAHVSVLATGEPVRSGRVMLTIGTKTLVADAPKRDGLFVPEGDLPQSGTCTAHLSLESDQASEQLDLGELVVHADESEARVAAEADSSAPLPGAVPFLMEQQWKVKLLFARAGPRSLTRRLVVPAQVRTPEGAEAAISAPVSGRLLAPASGRLAISGDAVEVGQLVGQIEPLLGAPELAQLQALQLEFDLKSLDVARALSEAQARLDFAERERERLGTLREHGLSTQQAIDEADRNLRVVQSEIAGARATKESLDRLIAERTLRAGDGSNPSLRVPLVAPLRGKIVVAGRLHGQSVEAGDEIFRVLDTTRVWIEAHIFEFDLHLLKPGPSASASFAALPGTQLEVGGASGRELTLLPTLDADSRTAVLRCEVPSADGAIKAGMQAELALALERAQASVAVPFEAVVIDQSAPTAYVMLEGELLQKRELELGIRDGEFVEVRRGIAAGELVVTRGAYVVKLTALSPTSFGAGHQH